MVLLLKEMCVCSKPAPNLADTQTHTHTSAGEASRHDRVRFSCGCCQSRCRQQANASLYGEAGGGFLRLCACEGKKKDWRNVAQIREFDFSDWQKT